MLQIRHKRLLFIRERPSQTVQVDSAKQIDLQKKDENLSFRDIMKMPLFLTCVIVFMLFGVVFNGVTNYSPSYLMNIGHSTMLVGTIIGALNASNALGKIVMGAINDRFGITACVLYGVILFALSMVVALLIPSAAGGFIFAILFGLSVPTASFPITILVSQIFGNETYSKALSVIQATFAIPVALSIPLAGFALDFSGSYLGVFVVYIFLAIIALVVYMNLRRRRDQGFDK